MNFAMKPLTQILRFVKKKKEKKTLAKQCNVLKNWPYFDILVKRVIPSSSVFRPWDQRNHSIKDIKTNLKPQSQFKTKISNYVSTYFTNLSSQLLEEEISRVRHAFASSSLDYFPPKIFYFRFKPRVTPRLNDD